ncbi:TraG family conjugative transposon ATPase [Chryseobacterium sp. SL1]|uniref:TraG family conjugative transposon ATPase n=1 Tax=Chryseobacterium sp. SL1 TaxID=2995159 RepID=UPI002273E205|nr:TraG family conjugative transposon ATPase [Chryseobacterium sp. SL1]MCY1659314.1 TraG family conjugative transposon ATPase [Chryseobacterium sp. SL1]
MNNIFLHLEDNKAVGRNGVFAMGYEISLAERYSMGRDDYESLDELWNKALKDMPVGSIFLKQDVFLKSNFDTSSFPDKNFLQKATKNYFQGREFMSHRCFVFFVLPQMNILETKISNPFKKLTKSKFEKFDDNINTFISSVEQSVAFLSRGKINAGKAFEIRAFTAGEMFDYYEYYFNNFQKGVVTDRLLKGGYIQVGDKMLGAICTRDEDGFPDTFKSLQLDETSNAKFQFYQNLGDSFSFKLDFDHVYNQIVFFEDNREQIAGMRKRQDLLKKTATFDPNNKVNAERLEDLINDVARNIDNERIVRGHLNVLFYGDNQEQLKSYKEQITNQFRNLDIKVRQPIGNYLNSIFCNSFYLFSHLFSEQQVYYGHLSTATIFFNNCSHYKNDQTGVIFNSRISNLPVVLDTWDAKKKYIRARNFMIFAPTGWGKSFLGNHLFRQFYEEENSRIVIIDLGGSYQKLSALYPEESVFVRYKEGEPIGLNPFDLQGGELSTTKVEELTEFIITHYKRDSKATEDEKTALRKLLKAYYDGGGKQGLIPFVQAIKESKDELLSSLEIKPEFFDVEKFLFSMSEFEEDGIYSFLYRSESNENLSKLRGKKFIVFELDEVKENPLLLSIMLQLTSAVIDDVVWKDKTTRGYIFYDEVAKQFKFPKVLERIEYQYQAIRKQNGAIGMVLQAISQLPNEGAYGQIAKTIIENTQVIYVLNAKDYRALQERFKMSEHAYQQMCSLESDFEGVRKYSEIFIMRGKHHQVYRLEVPNEVYWAYQTEGDENEELMQIYDKVQDMEKAIKYYMKQKSEVL